MASLKTNKILEKGRINADYKKLYKCGDYLFYLYKIYLFPFIKNMYIHTR